MVVGDGDGGGGAFGDLVLDFLTYISGVFLGYFVVLLYFSYRDFLFFFLYI